MQKHESNQTMSESTISLDEIRRYYFNRSKHTLNVEDAKYLLERAQEMGIDRTNGGVQALFSSLKYKFEE